MKLIEALQSVVLTLNWGYDYKAIDAYRTAFKMWEMSLDYEV